MENKYNKTLQDAILPDWLKDEMVKVHTHAHIVNGQNSSQIVYREQDVVQLLEKVVEDLISPDKQSRIVHTVNNDDNQIMPDEEKINSVINSIQQAFPKTINHSILFCLDKDAQWNLVPIINMNYIDSPQEFIDLINYIHKAIGEFHKELVDEKNKMN